MVSLMLRHGRITRRGTTVALLVILTAGAIMPATALPAEKISPSLLSEAVVRQAEQLATIDSDAGAMRLFTTTVGPALGLKDAAGTLGAKGLPAKLAKELGVTELSLTVHQLMAALAAWQLADAAGHGVDVASSSAITSPALPPAARQEWMIASGHVSALADLFRLLADQQPGDAGQSARQVQRMELALAANRVAFEAHQRATAAWWELHEWKDRIRQGRGQARLCGTWQWVIHNHQKHHQEQKLSLLFPPPGKDGAGIAGLAETIVLGDTVYLRWEADGRTQEDSLLFSKEGNRLEGTFVNSQGGWGSISGKRTASCTLQ